MRVKGAWRVDTPRLQKAKEGRGTLDHSNSYCLMFVGMFSPQTLLLSLMFYSQPELCNLGLDLAANNKNCGIHNCGLNKIEGYFCLT